MNQQVIQNAVNVTDVSLYNKDIFSYVLQLKVFWVFF